MMRVINKVLPSVDSEPNTMEIAGSLPLQIYSYTYQHRTRRYFFWVTTKVRETPTIPEICISLGARFGLNKTGCYLVETEI
jgi:hypothetical protein